MTNLITYYSLFLLTLISIATVGTIVYNFIQKPSVEQKKQILSWLLIQVTNAEKDLGSGTGKLKLSYVYGLFVQQMPALAKIVTFELFSTLVDQALKQLDEMLENNLKVQEYVDGEE